MSLSSRVCQRAAHTELSGIRREVMQEDASTHISFARQTSRMLCVVNWEVFALDAADAAGVAI